MLLLWPLGALAEDYGFDGGKISLVRAPNGKEKASFTASDVGIILPNPGTADDPTTAGVTIEFIETPSGTTATLETGGGELPDFARWKTLSTGYAFSNRQAPDALSGIRSLVLKNQRKIRISAKAISLPLDASASGLSIRITMGERRLCTRFGPETIRRNIPGRFMAKGSDGSGLSDCGDVALGIPAPSPTPTPAPTPTPTPVPTQAPDPEPILPINTEPCPTITNGDVQFLGKNVAIRVAPDAATKKGPLIFVWHGLGSQPSGAIWHLLRQPDLYETILDMGGMIVAPYGSGPPFEYGVADFLVADEIVACALEQVGIDERQIHSIGFSAGGLITTMMGHYRSNYIASIVGFAGGFLGPNQNPENLVPALIAHGGPSDFVFISFEDVMESYYDIIVNDGHYAILCRHNAGHTVPLSLRETSLDFFLDHPFGAAPIPYGDQLGPLFGSYCVESQ